MNANFATKALLSVLAILLASPLALAFTAGNNYSGTGFFVGEVLANSSVKISYSFIARESATVARVGVLTRKFGSFPVSYKISVAPDFSGVPGASIATGLFTSNLSGKVWKFVDLAPTAVLTAGTRYHLVMEYDSGTVSTSNYVTSASLGGLGQPDERWPLDLLPGGLKRLYFNGATWSTTNHAPSFVLEYTSELGSGNPYSSVTSARIFNSLWASELFTLNESRKLNTVSVLARKNSASTPSDHLYFQLRWANNTVITSFAVIASNTAVTTAYSWFTASMPTNFILSPGSYMLVLHSSASTPASVYRWLALSTVDFADSPNVNVTFNGTQSLLQFSGDSGNSWTQRRNMDYAFYFNTSSPDITPPVVSLLSPPNAANLTSGIAVNFSCSARDDFNLTKVELFANFTGTWALNGTNSTPINNSATNFTRTLPDGHYAWNCKGTDATGNLAFAPTNFSLTIDSTPPSSNITAPANNSIVNGVVTLTASAVDNFVGVANVSYEYFNASIGGGWTAIGNASASPYAVAFNVSSFAEGTLLVRSIARDRFGNTELAPANHTLRVDHTPPVPINLETFYAGIQDFACNGQSVRLELNVSDNFGVANVTVNASLIGGPSAANMSVVNGSFAGPWAIAQANLTVGGAVDEGEYLLPVIAWDQARPQANANATRFFEVEVKPPSDC